MLGWAKCVVPRRRFLPVLSDLVKAPCACCNGACPGAPFHKAMKPLAAMHCTKAESGCRKSICGGRLRVFNNLVIGTVTLALVQQTSFPPLKRSRPTVYAIYTALLPVIWKRSDEISSWSHCNDNRSCRVHVPLSGMEGSPRRMFYQTQHERSGRYNPFCRSVLPPDSSGKTRPPMRSSKRSIRASARPPLESSRRSRVWFQCGWRRRHSSTSACEVRGRFT